MATAINADPAASAMTTVKAPKKAKVTGKEKKALDHPTYAEMLVASISALAERKGSSRIAITNYVLQNYNVGGDSKKVGLHVSNSLRKGADSGLFERMSGVGANGRFRLGEAAKAATKKAAKKTTTTKSPKKAATGKSPKKASMGKSPKKAATAKSPKKTITAKSPKKAATAMSSKKAVGDKKIAAGKKTTAKGNSAKQPKPKSLKKVGAKSTKTTKALKKTQIAA